jgi:hypothetical protein
MELLLFLFFVIQLPGWSQDKMAAGASLDVEVLRFSWSHNRGGLLASERTETANPMNRPRIYRQPQIENNNTIENRIQDLRDMEDRVVKEKVDSPAKDTYSYLVELRNHGPGIIKWIFWDYQTSEPSDPENISHRQFACAVKIKPNESELLKAFSTLPPRMTINANANMKTRAEKLVINRVEYADGKIWQGPDWHLPDQFTSRSNGRGKCRPI